jgi:hypothetical protein
LDVELTETLNRELESRIAFNESLAIKNPAGLILVLIILLMLIVVILLFAL